MVPIIVFLLQHLSLLITLLWQNLHIPKTALDTHVWIASMWKSLTFINWSWASLVARSDCRLLRSCALVSMPLSQLSRHWNFCSICRSLARLLLSWPRVSTSWAWYNLHSCCRVSSLRSSIWGRPQGMTSSLLTSSVLSKAWPSVQWHWSSWGSRDGAYHFHSIQWKVLFYILCNSAGSSGIQTCSFCRVSSSNSTSPSSCV